MRDPFPGAIGVSHLLVYDTTAPDGLRGGTPHLHTACTEAYAVVAGRGRVQTLGGDGYKETPLEKGSFVWFTPGTVHRLVNDGNLEIFVLMQNAGLPEAGDMVLTFPPDVLADADRYAEAMALTPDGERRDLAVEGFLAIRHDGDVGALHAAAARLVSPRVEGWRDVWREGPADAVERTARHLDALAAGDADHLGESAVHALPPPAAPRRWGCCGTLGTYLP